MLGNVIGVGSAYSRQSCHSPLLGPEDTVVSTLSTTVSPFQKSNGFNMDMHLMPRQGFGEYVSQVVSSGDVLKADKATCHGLSDLVVGKSIPTFVQGRMWYRRTGHNGFVIPKEPRWTINRDSKHT